MDHQKLMDEKGRPVDFNEKNYDKSYYRIETDTHFIDRMAVTIENKKDEVIKLRDKKKFKDAELIAEGFIRQASRNKAVFKRVTREAYLASQSRSWKIFKENIFGYNELSKQELVDDQSGDDQKKLTAAEKKAKK